VISPGGDYSVQVSSETGTPAGRRVEGLRGRGGSLRTRYTGIQRICGECMRGPGGPEIYADIRSPALCRQEGALHRAERETG